MKFAIIAIAIVAACAVANVSAQEEDIDIDPTGQPNDELRSIGTCANISISELGMLLVPVFGIALVRFRPKFWFVKRPVCWREDFYGKGVTCKSEGKRGAEVCAVCR